MKPAIKCVNLDWLEVFCLEPADMPAQYRGMMGIALRQFLVYQRHFLLVNR